MNLVKTPGIIKRLFPGITWEIPGDKPAVYLTFDDGPTPGITDFVLEQLLKFNAGATFFCIGRNAERHPEIYRRITGAGHSVGNHTYSHLKGWYTGDKEYYADIELAGKFVHSHLFRPAYGMITPRQLKVLSQTYRVVLWDIMSYDFAYNTSPEQCLRNVIRHSHPGSIIVFHDSVKASEKIAYALPRALEYFMERRWEVKGIGSQDNVLQ